jgi:hypothetical protein
MGLEALSRPFVRRRGGDRLGGAGRGTAFDVEFPKQDIIQAFL